MRRTSLVASQADSASKKPRNSCAALSRCTSQGCGETVMRSPSRAPGQTILKRRQRDIKGDEAPGSKGQRKGNDYRRKAGEAGRTARSADPNGGVARQADGGYRGEAAPPGHHRGAERGAGRPDDG